MAIENFDGSPVTIQMGFWSHPRVHLVVNRGDYGLFDPAGTPEPESDLAPDSGRATNIIVLDPTDEHAYLESLAYAGYVQLTVRST